MKSIATSADPLVGPASSTRDPSDTPGGPRELVACCAPDGSCSLEWRPADSTVATNGQQFQELLAKDTGDAWLVRLAFADRSLALAPSLQFLRDFLGNFADWVRHTPEIETLRTTLACPVPTEALATACAAVPAMDGGEYVSADTLTALWDRMVGATRAELAAHTGSVATFLQKLNPELHLAGRVYFHLVENRRGSSAPFAFLATYSQTDPATGRVRHIPLQHALSEFAADPKALLHLLGTVHRAAATSTLMRTLLDTGELFHPLAWQPAEAFAFLREIPLYDASGILCRIPDWWKAAARGVQVSLAVGTDKPAGVGLDAILQCCPALTIDGVPITAEEARQLLDASAGLALIKNRWVAVDPDRLRRTLEAYDRLQEQVAAGLSIREALRLQQQPPGTDGTPGHEDAPPEITAGQWLAETMRRLSEPVACATVSPNRDFRAQLRPYQQQGLNWLAFLWQLGFGACLADDMGLGKTVQLLALLNTQPRAAGEAPALLVIPASLLANWQAEIARFYPTLRVVILHASAHEDGRATPPDKKTFQSTDLIITTYAMVVRLPWLTEQSWRVVVLDEAQAIKNPDTRQARAIKKLRAARRIAMTGTPVENRLSDLWSLFDFLNPGLLGSPTEFTRFTKSLHERPQGYARLRQVIKPYVLRRLKTDRAIITDLPDKVETKTFATLSRRQIVLYRQVLEELQRQIETVDDITRKGLVLGTLLRCKQICNHPDHYLGTGPFLEADSGKFERLREICETVQAKRERMLVFTQFREMADPLHDFLAGIFGRPGLTLHGGIAAAKRGALVAQFQGEAYVPFLVLTVKAGGVGLNLTRANHVVHFDRWWNPAVENQATDRAFRIGQQRDVLVHKFVVSGTIEERIDVMLEEKRKLAADVIATGGAEAVLTNMSNQELLQMFRLTL
jgi:non-specific serine/threonine protein kinase